MPKFPTKEVDIASLAYTMMVGYFAHMAEFPSVSPIVLFFKYRDYTTARNARSKAAAAAQLATEAKDNALQSLSSLMKSCLKKSQVDITNAPEKLEYIGWSPKAPPSPADPPGQPRNLEAITQEPSAVLLDWKSPAHGSGGAVRTYVIERRQQTEADGEFGSWLVVDSALGNKINLTGQPCGIQLEYRIKAINIGGESAPSNTAAVVL